MEVVTIDCEWDIGVNESIYATSSLARDAAREALESCGIEESMEELENEGLISFNIVGVVME